MICESWEAVCCIGELVGRHIAEAPQALLSVHVDHVALPVACHVLTKCTALTS